MITAHGGAEMRGRSFKKFFEIIRTGKITADAFEVDVRMKGGSLYLSHAPSLTIKGKIPFEEALLLAKEKNMQINCDLKNKKVVIPVLELINKTETQELAYLTGEFYSDQVENLDTARVFVNQKFFKHIPFVIPNLQAIARYLKKFGNEHIVGINVDKKHATDEFIQECKASGIGLSVYTVDDPKQLERLINADIANITTNKPSLANSIKSKLTN